jgi:integrase
MGVVRRALNAEIESRQRELTGEAREPLDPLFDPDRNSRESLSTEPRNIANLIARYRADREAEHGEADTAKDYGHIFRALEQLIGPERQVSEISRDDCRRVRDTLSRVPRSATKKYPKLTLIEAIAAGEEDGAPLLASTTLGTYMANLRALFNWAKRERWIEHNPVEGLVRKGKRSVRRTGFNPDHLKTIFNGLRKFRETQPVKFWVPALALFTGARLGELCQLRVGDIVYEGKIACLDLSEFDEQGRRASDKGLKTPHSERYVPLHPQLVEAGFLDYVERRRRAGHVKLFDRPNPKAKEELSHSMSKWFGYFMDGVGLPERALVFHGFRHGFRNACRLATISQETAEALGGWATDRQSAKYGDRGMVPVLYPAVRRLKFGSFKLSDYAS